MEGSSEREPAAAMTCFSRSFTRPSETSCISFRKFGSTTWWTSSTGAADAGSHVDCSLILLHFLIPSLVAVNYTPSIQMSQPSVGRVSTTLFISSCAHESISLCFKKKTAKK